MATTQPGFNPAQHRRQKPKLDAESHNSLYSIRLEEEFRAVDDLSRCQQAEEICFALSVFVYRTFFRGLRMILFRAYRVEVVEELQRWLLDESLVWCLQIAKNCRTPLGQTEVAHLQRAIKASVQQCENWWRYRRALKKLADAWELQHLIDSTLSHQQAGSSDAGNLSGRLRSGWNYLEEAFGHGSYDGPELFVLADCEQDLRAVTHAPEVDQAWNVMEAKHTIQEEPERQDDVAEYNLSVEFREELERCFPLLLKSPEEITERYLEMLYAQRKAFVDWCCGGDKNTLGLAAGFKGVRPDRNINKWLNPAEKRHNGSTSDRKILYGAEKLWHKQAG